MEPTLLIVVALVAFALSVFLVLRRNVRRIEKLSKLREVEAEQWRELFDKLNAEILEKGKRPPAQFDGIGDNGEMIFKEYN